MPMADEYVLTNARLATMQTSENAFGLIDKGAVAITAGQIGWVGNATDLPTKFTGWPDRDMAGRLITPGLIDCHTHIIFGGSRADEFEMRLNGASYFEIAQAGGGIVSTVAATRAASIDELVSKALPRLDALIGQGVTTLEIKSGYGLDQDTELNMLRAARRLGELRQVQIKTSFLGAHTTAVEYKGRNAEYVSKVCIPTLNKAHAEGLVDAVDGFCENIAFTPDELEPLFKQALKLGLPIKLHAEQLSNSGGTQLAARYGAISVDHLEFANEEDVACMAKSGSVAVILPGAFYTLGETQLPPIDKFRRHGVAMAVATDGNPGSSPMFSILLAMNMSCTLFAMTPLEALAGVTCNSARALGLNNVGMIQPGFRADLAIWDCENPAELSYNIGFNSLHGRIFGGAE